MSSAVPGIRTSQTTGDINPIALANPEYIPGGIVVDATYTRDYGNTANTDVIRRGTVLKRGSSGLYIPAILGLVTSNYTSGGTSLTVGAVAASNLEKALGTSGTGEFYVVGAPSSPSAVADIDAIAATHSAVNTSTGVITISNLGANVLAGAVLLTFQPVLLGGTGGVADHGEGFAIVDDITGVKVTEDDGSTEVDAHAKALIGGLIDYSRLLPFAPSTYINQVLAHNLKLGSRFMFDLEYGG